MNDLTRYRIDTLSHIRCFVPDDGKVEFDGTLVPDSTLQDIADAWKAYVAPRAGDNEWVPLKALLDALERGD